MCRVSKEEMDRHEVLWQKMHGKKKNSAEEITHVRKPILPMGQKPNRLCAA